MQREPYIKYSSPHFFSVMFSSHCCHLFISNMRQSAAPHRISKCLVTFSYTHIVVFGHQFCGFVYLNVYYQKLKNSILLIEFGEVCCRVERARGAAGVGVMFNVQRGMTSQQAYLHSQCQHHMSLRLATESLLMKWPILRITGCHID